MSQLTGKVALVTGASRGLGKGIAIGLGEAGATVYITGRSLSQANDAVGGSLAETQLAVEKAGGKCIAIPVDHSDDQQVELLFNRIDQEQQGQLDLLVNNAYAGVRTLTEMQGKPFWESEPQVWDEINNVGLRSHYVAAVLAAIMMVKRRQGLICTISSWGGFSYLFSAVYGIGKSACDRLAADFATELQPYNVASVAVWPGIVNTEHMSRVATEIEASSVTTDDPAIRSLVDRYNWETPLLTGRVIAALAADPNIMRRSGRLQIVAERAQEYNLVDENGNRPVSLRSLRFLLSMKWPQLQKSASLIPNVNIPWSVLLSTMLKSPKI
ncbi:short-chain dehydrogenase [Limnospira fusiformis CCALA 023]|uniref:SDR family NAD(P)-dependent oxidoreductase n=1 Tax=Oscillatoriales TaxID=1150 RepID=UPI00396D707B